MRWHEGMQLAGDQCLSLPRTNQTIVWTPRAMRELGMVSTPHLAFWRALPTGVGQLPPVCSVLLPAGLPIKRSMSICG